MAFPSMNRNIFLLLLSGDLWEIKFSSLLYSAEIITTFHFASLMLNSQMSVPWEEKRKAKNHSDWTQNVCKCQTFINCTTLTRKRKVWKESQIDIMFIHCDILLPHTSKHTHSAFQIQTMAKTTENCGTLKATHEF